MVRTASRMVRAISLGVFWRLAPSTRVIIRSRKVWPGSAVMRTTMRSDSTLVPPVTAERSPPDSRMTGADSPVMADSSTEATPSTISPSEGMTSPASQTTRSPLLSVGRRHRALGAVGVAGAGLRSPVRIRRSVSAWALPRPSAMASAKLAKSTVRNSQMVIDQVKMPGWAMASMKVMTVPTSTTNMTGFLIWSLGFSFLNGVDQGVAQDLAVEQAAGLGHAVGGRSAGGVDGGRRCRAAGVGCFVHGCPVLVGCAHQKNFPWTQLLDDRAEGHGREEGQAADDHDDADGEADEHGVVGPERPERLGHDVLGRQGTRRGPGPGS